MHSEPAGMTAGRQSATFLQGAKLHACQGAAGITLPVHQRRRVLFVRAESSGNRANSVMALSRARAGAGAGAGAGVVGLPACLCSLHSEQAIVKDKGARPVTEQSDDLMTKIKAAWAIFFPPKPERVSAKEAGKSRLRMILVADRCGMNQASMFEMRHSIVKAVSDFVEIEGEDNVEVNISTEPELGTVYSVAVPVRRVKAQARFGTEEEEGTTIMFDADGEDQADRFPYGC